MDLSFKNWVLKTPESVHSVDNCRKAILKCLPKHTLFPESMLAVRGPRIKEKLENLIEKMRMKIPKSVKKQIKELGTVQLFPGLILDYVISM